jgi:hypothetical protein
MKNWSRQKQLEKFVWCRISCLRSMALRVTQRWGESKTMRERERVREERQEDMTYHFSSCRQHMSYIAFAQSNNTLSDLALIRAHRGERHRKIRLRRWTPKKKKRGRVGESDRS